MDPALAFGRALRRRRVSTGWSQEKLALEAGLARVFVSWMETGRKQPTFQTMLKLSAALNCSAAELVMEAEALLTTSDVEDP